MRNTIRIALLAAVLTVCLAPTSVAGVAMPQKGSWKGQTSQGGGVSFKIAGKGKHLVAKKFRIGKLVMDCHVNGNPAPQPPFTFRHIKPDAVPAPLASDGTFAFDAPFIRDSIDIHGEGVSGGTMYGWVQADYTGEGGLSCDSGKVQWQAKLG